MITKVAVGSNFNFKRNHQCVPDYESEPDRPITKAQRQTLVELIYSRISNPEEIERRLSQIEDYNYLDISEAIGDLLFSTSK